jgi:hypothetical protein
MTVAGLGSISLSADTREHMLESGDVLRVLAQLPSGGNSVMPFLMTSERTSAPDGRGNFARSRVAARISPNAAADLFQLITLARRGSP